MDEKWYYATHPQNPKSFEDADKKTLHLQHHNNKNATRCNLIIIGSANAENSTAKRKCRSCLNEMSQRHPRKDQPLLWKKRMGKSSAIETMKAELTKIQRMQADCYNNEGQFLHGWKQTYVNLVQDADAFRKSILWMERMYEDG